jgi:hypothetical protein
VDGQDLVLDTEHEEGLILELTNVLSSNPILHPYPLTYPDAFKPGIVDIALLSRATELEGLSLLVMNDQTAWVNGNLICPLFLWNYDGMRIGMDSLLAHDPFPSPLPEHEFVTQWDCDDKPSSPLSSTLMHFHDHLAYLCEASHIMSTSPPPQQGSIDWGSGLYLNCYGDGSYTVRYRRSRFYRIGSSRVLAGSLPNGFLDGL